MSPRHKHKAIVKVLLPLSLSWREKTRDNKTSHPFIELNFI